MRSITLVLAILLLPISVMSAAPEAVPYTPHLAEIPEGDNAICCVQGDTLHLAGSFANQGYTASVLMFPRQVLQTHQVEFDPDHPLSYSFRYPSPAPGDYLLRIGAIDLNEHTVVLRELHLTVFAEPPVLTTRPTVTTEDLSVAALPQSSDFRVARVHVALGGESGDSQAAGGLTAHLSTSTLRAGDYTLSSQVWDERGRFFDAGEVPVVVPDRLTLACASSVTLHRIGDKFPLTVRIADGVHASQVAYFVDGVQVAESRAPPFSASCVLSGFATGTHRLQARMTAAGQSYDAPPLNLALTNLAASRSPVDPPKHPVRHQGRRG